MESADKRFSYLDKDGEILPDGTPFEQVGRFEFQCRAPLSPSLCEASLGIGGRCSINLNASLNAGYPAENKQWILRGAVDQPTITPSINCSLADKPCWHGYIKGGVFTDCNGKAELQQ
jgi:hypothetical protein